MTIFNTIVDIDILKTIGETFSADVVGCYKINNLNAQPSA